MGRILGAARRRLGNVGEHAGGSRQGFPVVWRSLGFYRERCREAGLRLEVLDAVSAPAHHSGIESQDAQWMLRMRLPDLPWRATPQASIIRASSAFGSAKKPDR